jgi:V8-like Glu-specific endopeptidase
VILHLERLDDRIVPSLTAVDPSVYPLTSIVKLNVTFPDGQQYVGSGAMVDSFHTLTAAHMMYSSADGGWATSIEVIPQLAGNTEPVGDAWMTTERTYQSFLNYENNNPGSTTEGVNDIGLLTLDRNIGDSTGWMSFGYNNNDNQFAAGTIMNTAGYPADPASGFDGTTMAFSSGPLAGLSGDGSSLEYYQSDITTYGGQSGSPIWLYNPDNGSRTIYGVVDGGGNNPGDLNFGTRINQQIFNDFTGWMSSDVAPNLVQPGQIGDINPIANGGLFGFIPFRQPLAGTGSAANLAEQTAAPHDMAPLSLLERGDSLDALSASGASQATVPNLVHPTPAQAPLALQSGPNALDAASLGGPMSTGLPLITGARLEQALGNPTVLPSLLTLPFNTSTLRADALGSPISTDFQWVTGTEADHALFSPATNFTATNGSPRSAAFAAQQFTDADLPRLMERASQQTSPTRDTSVAPHSASPDDSGMPDNLSLLSPADQVRANSLLE